MDQITQQQLIGIVTKLEEATQMLKSTIGGVEKTEHIITSIEKYVSGSGNTTWRALNEDATIYLRQAHKKMLEESGIWETLNELDYDEPKTCSMTIETIPDGDFLKPVNIVSELEIFD